MSLEFMTYHQFTIILQHCYHSGTIEQLWPTLEDGRLQSNLAFRGLLAQLLDLLFY